MHLLIFMFFLHFPLTICNAYKVLDTASSVTMIQDGQYFLFVSDMTGTILMTTHCTIPIRAH